MDSDTDDDRGSTQLAQSDDSSTADVVESTNLIDQALALCQRYRRALEIFPDKSRHTRLLSEHFCFVEYFDYQRHRLAHIRESLPSVRTHRLALHADSGPSYAPNVRPIDRTAERGPADARTVRSGDRPVSNRARTADRVPGAMLDDMGWDDIDLIVVSALVDLLPFLVGARRTLKLQRPTLLVHTQDVPAETLGLIIGEICTLTDGDYRIAFANRDGFILQSTGQAQLAQPNMPAMVKISGLIEKKEVMLLGVPAGTVRGITSSQALIGRTLVPATVVRRRTWHGPRETIKVELARSVKTIGFAGLRLANQKLIPFPAEDHAMSISDLISRTDISADGSGVNISFPYEISVIATNYSVSLEFGNGEVFSVGNGQIDDDQLIERVRMRWPLNVIRPQQAMVVVNVYADGTMLGSCATEIDFVRNHLSDDTVNGFLNHGGGGNPAVSAMAQSLGCRTRYAEDGFRPGVAVVWGVLRGSKVVIDEAIKRGTIFYYIDHAYFDRGHRKSYRITRDRFEAGPVRDCPDDRFAALDIDVAPWKSGGRFIVVCPPTAHFIKAHNCADWLETTLATLKRFTDREVVIREKPSTGQMSPLSEALDDAHALVTHSSNVAIEAALLGTPVFVSETSAAYPIGLSDLSRIESPVRPAREKWLSHLAYSQFSFEEMRSGDCWRMLREFEDRPLISIEH